MSDVALLEQGYVAAVPIHVGELTCNETLQKHKAMAEKAINGISLPHPSGTPR